MLCLLTSFANAPVIAQKLTSEPEQVQLEVGDIRRLAQVLGSIDGRTAKDLAPIIERQYLAKASPGLRSYAGNYKVTSDSITSAIKAQPSLYADLDSLADAFLAEEKALRTAFRKLKVLFPDAVFPPIWFVVGHNGPGGLTRPEGVLIASERFKDRPQDVVPLVLHELAHFQQAAVQGVDVYQRIYGPKRTLLALALREGTAELIAEITTGRHINPAAERYGLPREPQLWSKFRKEMHGGETGDWMFVRPTNAEWPPDLGYWIGYRIAKSYYERADNKQKAILDILGLTDFDAFLKASRYTGGIAKSIRLRYG